MESIERIRKIKREKLNGECYVQSLLEEAYRLGMVTDADVERIQYECLELAADRTKRYNSGDSSSVRIEAAQCIMLSNLYTIGLWLKSYANADDAVKTLKETKIAELYANGRKRIDTLLKVTKALHYKVRSNMFETGNVFYNDTVINGIKGFFKIYNPDFEAHEIRITVDYRPYNPVKNLVGIEFIQKYLEMIYYENMFCRNFSPEDAHHVLCGYDGAYQNLPINLYEPILATAVGCVLSGENIHRLDMNETAIAHLSGMLKDKTRDEINTIVLSAFDELKFRFPPVSNLHEQYIKLSLWEIGSRVSSAVKLQTLDKVFLIARYPENNPKIYFSYEDKMEDALYRKMIHEIMQCRYLSDKIAIITKQVHSFADLEDVLLDAKLQDHEIVSILRELELTEIAVLSKNYLLNPDVEALELREQERILSRCLQNFIASLPEERQTQISKTVDMLDMIGK